MTNQPIYFDNAATTKTAPQVLAAMADTEADLFYNSSALYKGAADTAAQIQRAKEIIKNKLGGSNGELHFMSGATESNNTVIFGKIRRPSQHLIVMAGEHSSVHSPAVYLEQNGYRVDYAPLLPSGEADIDAAADLVTPNTALFVFGLVNSDIGTLQDAKKIVTAIKAKNKGTHIHCDAAQAFCKYEFDAESMGFDSVTISAHKINGGKGIGALWLRRGVTLPALLYGGDHGLRPGTENNAAIIGFAKAAEIFDTRQNFAVVSKLHEYLINNLPVGCKVNGINNNPYITNILLPGIFGETVLNALNAKNIYVGLGSACSVNSAVNRTLRAIGLSPKQQKQVLRISFGPDNTITEVAEFLQELNHIIANY